MVKTGKPQYTFHDNEKWNVLHLLKEASARSDRQRVNKGVEHESISKNTLQYFFRLSFEFMRASKE